MLSNDSNKMYSNIGRVISTVFPTHVDIDERENIRKKLVEKTKQIAKRQNEVNEEMRKTEHKRQQVVSSNAPKVKIKEDDFYFVNLNEENTRKMMNIRSSYVRKGHAPAVGKYHPRYNLINSYLYLLISKGK